MARPSFRCCHINRERVERRKEERCQTLGKGVEKKDFDLGEASGKCLFACLLACLFVCSLVCL